MKVLLVQPPKAPVTLGGEDVFLFEPLALSVGGMAGAAIFAALMTFIYRWGLRTLI